MSATLQALDGAPLAHLAAHGHHDRENFLFSRLDLADGPLMAYDIQQLTAAPRHVILSACDVGRTVVRPGEEILGFTAALLYIGTATVISSVTRVARRRRRRHDDRLPSPARGRGQARRGARRGHGRRAVQPVRLLRRRLAARKPAPFYVRQLEKTSGGGRRSPARACERQTRRSTATTLPRILASSPGIGV